MKVGLTDSSEHLVERQI